MQASDVMTEEVITVRAETSVQEIASLLTKHRVGGVPVVDDRHHVIGMVNESDLFLKERGVPFSRERMPALFDQYVDPEQIAEKYKDADHVTAADVMTKAVASVEAQDDVGQVAETMMRLNLRRVPVLRDGKLVGIISRSDIIGFLAEEDGGVDRDGKTS